MVQPSGSSSNFEEMAAGETEQSISPQAAVGNVVPISALPTTMCPELLMAACHGNHQQLASLLDRECHPDAVEAVQLPTGAGAGMASASQAAAAVVIGIDRSSGATTVCSAAPASSSWLLRCLTPDGDSALHLVAGAGDNDAYLKSAMVIYDMDRRLLMARNRGGSTPYHRAARAGNVAMLSLLVSLARAEAEAEAGAAGRAEAVLRTRNATEETALHEAIRAGDMRAVDVLMAADPCLARFPPDDGASPLFLAVSLCRYGIARQLHARDSRLSYAGPHGQNALHAAVLRSTDMTELLLGWNKHLTKQCDHHGRTPLHFAVSSERETCGLLPQYALPVKQGVSITSILNIREPPLELAKQIIDADIYSAYRADKKGSFPVHIAASAGRLYAINILITRYPGCAALRDSDGRTFLHVAVKKRRYHVVAYACKTLLLSTVLNMQDNDGNTALHLAVEVGDWCIFARLFVNKQVELNLLNNRQETPLELSINNIPTGLYCSLLDSRILIHETLMSANASRGLYWLESDVEKIYDPQLEAEDGKKGSDIVSNSSQFTSIGLVLVTTMTFGATFALPGGYIADDHPHGGTPTLAQGNFFQAFMMANTIAFFCSSLAVMSLTCAGSPTVELPLRYRLYNISCWLSFNAGGSLAIAFIIAVHMMITPVAATTTIAVIVVIISVVGLYFTSVIEKYAILLIALWIRIGIPVLRSGISKLLFFVGWPLVVIFGFQLFAWMYQ